MASGADGGGRTSPLLPLVGDSWPGGVGALDGMDGSRPVILWMPSVVSRKYALRDAVRRLTMESREDGPFGCVPGRDSRRDLHESSNFDLFRVVYNYLKQVNFAATHY